MRKTPLAVILLVSLLFLSTTASANNISLSKSIATHTFKSFDGDTLVSEGYFTINNQEKKEVELQLGVQTELNILDLNKTTGEPRTHSVEKNVIMHPAPTSSWITFPESTFTIGPKESKKVSYNISIPVSELPSYTGKTDGFLMYITITTVEREGNKAGSIGVNYKYKVFTVFKQDLPAPVLPYALLITASLILALIIFTINDKLHITQKIKEKRLRE